MKLRTVELLNPKPIFKTIKTMYSTYRPAERRSRLRARISGWKGSIAEDVRRMEAIRERVRVGQESLSAAEARIKALQAKIDFAQSELDLPL